MTMKCLPTRYIIALLTSLGLALLYAQRIHINLTIVSMVNHTVTEENHTGVCTNITQKERKIRRGEYNWSNELQGTILSSFYWGYIVVLFPSARLCELTSVKWVFFAGMVLNIIPCLLIPISSSTHYVLVIIMRVLQGLGNGATIPATSLILARWVPKSEKNTMASLVFSGSTAGMVIGILIIGLINTKLNWQCVFYITGSSCIPWLFAWGLLAADSPTKAKFIRTEEVDLIMSSIGNISEDKTKIVIHWKNIFTSKPFWALFITHGCGNWIGYLLITDIPIYLYKVFLFRVDDITSYTAIGGVLSAIFSISLGRTMDYFRKKKHLSQTWAKKIMILITYTPIVFMVIGLAYVGCSWLTGVIVLILVMMLLGGAYCGWLSNHIDIGPKIAATLMALTNLAGTTSGIVVPVFVGWILGDGTNMKSWFIIFWVTAGFLILLIVVYTLFGSGEVQNYYSEVELSERT